MIGKLLVSTQVESLNQSANFNRKSISRNTTHRQSYKLQAMFAGETLKGLRAEKANKLNVKSEHKLRQIKTLKTYLSQIIAITAVLNCNCSYFHFEILVICKFIKFFSPGQRRTDSVYNIVKTHL